MKTTLSILFAAASTMLFAAGAPYKDLPAELKSVPAGKITMVDGKFLSVYTNGKIRKDAASTMAQSSVWLPKDQKSFKLPFAIGIYDRPTKKVAGALLLKTVAPDEKYHWVKVASNVKIGKDSIIYLVDWHIGFYLKSFYKPAGNNTYDVWVSVKAQGPGYVKGSKKTNELAVDRAVLVDKSK